MKDNTITLKTEHLDEVVLWLDAPLVDLSSPIVVTLSGASALTSTRRPNVGTYCTGLEERGDPRLATPLRIEVNAHE